MIEQLKTTREGIEAAIASGVFIDKPVRRALLDALTALSELERMAGSQEPVAWGVYWGLPPTRKNSVHFDKGSAQAVANQIKSATEVRPLYAAPPAQQPQYEAGDMASAAAQGFRDGVASVAQQPQARPDFTDEWTGYLKDGETPFERFLRERKDMQSVLKLYQRVLEENERLNGQQPQAEAVPPGYALVPVEPDEMWAYRVIRHHQPNLDVGCKAWLECLKEMLHWHAAIAAQGEKP